jgi:pimeloyl-[acyl-carrier protein] methyl ester esterase
MNNEQGPNCVLLHGWGVSNSVWDGFAKQLNCFKSVGVPCLYTASSKAKNIEALAEAIKEKIENDTVVVAWSLGGLVATRLASLSNKIKAIVYIASPPCFVNKSYWKNVLEGESIHGLQDSMLNDSKATLEYFAGLIAHGDKDTKKIIRIIRTNLANEKYSGTLSIWLNELLEQDQRKEFAALNIPTLHVLAEGDALINHRIENQIKQLQPKSECAVIKNSCHAPFVGQPEATAKIINEFISARFKQ